MAHDKRVAVTLPGGPRVKDTIDRVQWAEANGFTDAWLADGAAPDALTLAAILGDHSKSIRIGTAVTPVYTRAPTVLAATLFVVAQQLQDRFVFGMGSSSKNMITGWNGIPLDKPKTRVVETVQVLRAMLAGEKSDFDGETVYSKGYRQPPLPSPPPLYMAALRPAMIEAAAQHADGVIFNLWPEGALAKMVEHVDTGAAAGGKSERPEIVNRFMVCVTDDKAAARDAFRSAFAPYYATPQYNKFLAWAGYEDAAEAIRQGWAEKDRDKTTGALTDEMVDAIGVIGDADECREKIRRAMDTGIDTAIIAPMAGSPEQAQATLDAFTAENFAV
jgi:probable F420-dependent oxidoreductase